MTPFKPSALKPLVERKISLILHLATVIYPISSSLYSYIFPMLYHPCRKHKCNGNYKKIKPFLNHVNFSIGLFYEMARAM
jgi:hypothetical protein